MFLNFFICKMAWFFESAYFKGLLWKITWINTCISFRTVPDTQKVLKTITNFYSTESIIYFSDRICIINYFSPIFRESLLHFIEEIIWSNIIHTFWSPDISLLSAINKNHYHLTWILKILLVKEKIDRIANFPFKLCLVVQLRFIH